MWIKTDDRKWCNLDHYCCLQIGSNTDGKWEVYGNLVGKDGVSCIYTTFAELKELPEGQRILSNIFYCLKRGDAAVDVADLRDIDLEKRDKEDQAKQIQLNKENCLWRRVAIYLESGDKERYDRAVEKLREKGLI